MSTPVVALDIGSGFVKAVTHLHQIDRRISSPSLVSEVDAGLLCGFGAEGLPIIEYQGKKWVTGSSLLRVMSADKAQNTLSMDWTGSDGWMVLLIRALSDLHITQGAVHLVTGVPQRAYAERAPALQARLVGRHQAVVDGRPFDVEILPSRPVIMPQAVSGMFYWMDLDPTVAQGRVGGIDVGTYTTGYAVLENGEPKIDASSGIELGMHNVAATVARRVLLEYDLPLSNADALRLLVDPHLSIDGRVEDLSEFIHAAAHEAAQPVINRIRTHWDYGGKTMRIGLYGGGAPLFYRAFRQAFPHIEYVGDMAQAKNVFRHPSDTRFAPALGMLAFLAARLNRSASIRNAS